MPEAFLSRNKKGKYITGVLLGFYLLYVFFVYLSLYKGAFFADSIAIPSSDVDQFINLADDFASFGLKSFTIKNIIFSVIMFLSGEHFFSMVWTSLILYLCSLVLIYKTANLYKGNGYAGLLGVFIFTGFYNLFLNVFALNLHVSEMLMLLLVVYFYGKSNFCSDKIYSLLYLIFALLSFFERESIVMYLALIAIVSSFYQIKKKMYAGIFYNLIILSPIVFVFFTGSNSSYLLGKLDHWYIYTNLLDFVTVVKVPYYIVEHFFKGFLQVVSPFYLILILSIVFWQVFYSLKNKVKFFTLIEIVTGVVFFVYCLTIFPDTDKILNGMFKYRGAMIYDILPVFALLAIAASSFLYSFIGENKYLFFGICLLCLIQSSVFLDQCVKNFHKNQAEKVYESVYAQTCYNIAKETENIVKLKKHDKILFVLETVNPEDRKNFQYQDWESGKFLSEKDRLLSQKMDSHDYFMEFLTDVVLLNGYQYSRQINGYVINALNLSKEGVLETVSCFKNGKTEHINTPIDINKIKSWDILLNGIECRLSFYRLAKN